MYSTIIWLPVTMRGGRDYGIICAFDFGRLAEWLNAAVLKTVDSKGSGGSNPSPSANDQTSPVMMMAIIRAGTIYRNTGNIHSGREMPRPAEASSRKDFQPQPKR